MNEIPTFETFDVDFAAYLMFNGLKFIECKQETHSTGSKPRVSMKFFDEKGVCRDLERVYVNSEIARYRSFHKYLLKEIHRTLRGIGS
jgi:hypothetical protein